MKQYTSRENAMRAIESEVKRGAMSTEEGMMAIETLLKGLALEAEEIKARHGRPQKGDAAYDRCNAELDKAVNRTFTSSNIAVRSLVRRQKES